MIQGSVDLGRSVPQDLAVTGCDNTFFSGVSRPTVTSIAQPVWELARTGIDLLARPSKKRQPQSIELDPVLHVPGFRGSPNRVRFRPEEQVNSRVLATRPSTAPQPGVNRQARPSP